MMLRPLLILTIGLGIPAFYTVGLWLEWWHG